MYCDCFWQETGLQVEVQEQAPWMLDRKCTKISVPLTDGRSYKKSSFFPPVIQVLLKMQNIVFFLERGALQPRQVFANPWSNVAFEGF